MTNIIDRRLNPKDKNIKNREKFVQRSREQIKRDVKDAIDNGNISDIEKNRVRVKVKGIDEPTFGIDPMTGDKHHVLPGNHDYVVGDQQQKPQDSAAEGEGNQGGRGRGEDNFEFVLTRDEFLDFVFEDLELPDLVKKQIKTMTKTLPKRAGYTNVGNPCQLDVVRSLKNSLGRRIGLKRPSSAEVQALEQQLKDAATFNNVELYETLLAELEAAKKKQRAIPWLDPFDIRYRNYTPQPQPVTQAVMFCVMDVSSSMGKREKDLSKRFFFLLYMFLSRKYDKLDIIFIRHHEEAEEVKESEFFHSKVNGGTIISSALQLTEKIIKERYNVDAWNIYVCQASDGDNFRSDSPIVNTCMNNLLPLVQFFAYIEVSQSYRSSATDVWENYEKLAESYKNLAMRRVRYASEIWPIFLDLFSKENAHV